MGPGTNPISLFKDEFRAFSPEKRVVFTRVEAGASYITSAQAAGPAVHEMCLTLSVAG